MAKSKKSDKKKGGLTARTFGGLNKKRYTKGTGGDRIILKQGDTVSVQFVAPIDDEEQWIEIDQHQFQEKNRWNYVPCIGDNCPLCDDDDSDVRKIHYRFFTNAYDFKQKKVAILEGPKDLSGRIAFKAEKAEKKAPGKFLKMCFDISKFPTTPVSYEVDVDDEHRPVKIDKSKLVNLREYLDAQIKRYYGDDMPKPSSKKSKKTAMDDDDDEYEEDEEYTQEELEEMDWAELKKLAKSYKIKLVDADGNKRKRAALVRLILKKQ